MSLLSCEDIEDALSLGVKVVEDLLQPVQHGLSLFGISPLLRYSVWSAAR